MASFKVKFSCVLDKHGASRLRNEIVSDAELADVQRLLDLDAIEAAEAGTETGKPPVAEAGTETGKGKGK